MIVCEQAWAAGFFDGEGTTRAHRRKYDSRIVLSVRVQATQADPRALERLRAAVGGEGSIRLERMRPGRPGDRLMWRWSADTRSALRALHAMWPWLGPVKRDQARVAIRAAYAGRGAS